VLRFSEDVLHGMRRCEQARCQSEGPVSGR
jgi:hypothetical protein